MEKPILVIQHDEDRFAVLKEQIRLNFPDKGIVWSRSKEEALSLQQTDISLIIAELPLGLIATVSPVRELKRHFTGVPVIVLSDKDSLDTYVYAISQGAEDVLVDGHFDSAQLKKAIVVARERGAYLQKVQHALEDYKRHFYNGPIPMWINDEKNMRFLDVNTAAIEKYGYSREEFLRMTLLDIRPKEDIAEMLQHYTSRKSPFYDAGYWRHMKKNGEIFYVHIYSHTTLFENTDARLCFAVDVNDKLMADKRNKELATLTLEQKEQMDVILSSINEAIWSRNAETHELLFGNDAYYELYGYKPGDPALRKNLDIDRIHPDDREIFLTAIREVKRTGKADYTYRYMEPDGKIRILKGKAVFTKGKDGKPDTVDGVSADITREKELYDQIRNSEQKLLTTINNTQDLIWSVDRNLRIIFCNKPFKNFFHKWFGITLDEGDYVLGNWHPDEFIEKRKKEYERALGGESFITTVEERFNHGSQYFEISTSPIIDVDGKIIGVNCVSRDITEMEKQSRRISAQNEQLREIAWIQSHKVRGPVASILGLIPLFDKESCGSDYNKDILEKLEMATNQLDSVIKEIVSKTREIDENNL